MSELENKVALVTGASHPRGIGFAIAKKLAALGATIVITDLKQASAQLDDAVTDIQSEGVTAMAQTADVTSVEQVKSCVDNVIEHFGRIDILVNNAGVGGGGSEFLKLTPSDFELAYKVNVGGVANLCQAVIPHMLKQGSGAIVNVASLCGLGAIPEIPHSYTASKFAAVGLTKAIALEYASRGIRCNAVCPGVVNTDMRDQLLQRMSDEHGISVEEAERLEDKTIAIGRGAEASEIADTVAYLAGPSSAYVTGVAVPVAGGLAAGL